ncbi:histidine--tRNA ligase [Candidatus Atribacteria bacterium 1244-E10-H5-B2]|nr:MAG: histidine--tRNA ligase [Candidatus Atribacteria bacterium 1244-E10-H5-B2]
MFIKVPKGTQDILPEDISKWYYIEDMIKEILNKYGYKELRTPVFEYTDLFVRGIGESTDIVTKEMFTFLDRKGRSLTLRPEGTAPVVRAYLENRMDRISKVIKLFYLGPMFRCEKPQAGRFRQFNQFGIEIIGTKSSAADAEVILTVLDVYKKLGLKNLEILINSVGCKKCRVDYVQKLKKYLKDKKDFLCSECKERYKKNPLRVLDCKKDSCKRIIEAAPVIIENLCQECESHFSEVKSYLDDQKIIFHEDPQLVRGLDYYTKTAFEIISGGLGAQNAIGGGGRYDDLVEELGGKPTPAVGFAAGIERMIMAIDQQKVEWPMEKGLDIFVAKVNERNKDTAFRLLQKIRNAGLSADMDYSGGSLKSQMRIANKIRTRYTVIIGEEELSKNMVILRNMQTKEQKEVQIDNLINELSS